MKIGFTGTMSVGKSTLVHALKELPEFKDYFFDQYGQTLFSVEDMSKLLKYYKDYQEEKNKEERSERAGKESKEKDNHYDYLSP